VAFRGLEGAAFGLQELPELFGGHQVNSNQFCLLLQMGKLRPFAEVPEGFAGADRFSSGSTTVWREVHNDLHLLCFLVLTAPLSGQRERQNTVIGWITRDVLPAMKDVWRYLLHQKKTPKECLILDNAIAQLEGDLAYLWMGNSI
jgi:hypothetical protein